MTGDIVLVLLCASPFLLVARAAHAEAEEDISSQAARLFQQGREAMRQGKYDAACRDFAESQRLDPSAGTLLNEAVCRERLGHLLRSRELVHQFVRATSPTDDRGPRAVALAANLDERIPMLTIEVPSDAPQPAQLLLDETEIPRDKWNSAIAVEPGDHDVLFRAPRFVEWRDHRTITESQRLTITIKPVAVVTTPESAVGANVVTMDPPPERLPPLFWGAAAVGGAGLVTAAASGALVFVNRSIVDDHCIQKRCDAEGLAAGERGSTWATVNTIALPIGIVGTAFAVYLFVSRRPATTRVSGTQLRFDKSAAAIVVGGEF